jgi:hypothetical protein
LSIGQILSIFVALTALQVQLLQEHLLQVTPAARLPSRAILPVFSHRVV